MKPGEPKKADRSKVALLVIDVINDLEFPGGERVLPWAERMAARLTRFRAAAHRHGVPVIYANDNCGLWRGDFAAVYARCTRPAARGRNVARRLRPTAADYLILKPRHSAFFASPLQPLLEDLGTERLILTGLATNLCVLFTAHDAHMLKYKITVLSDCCAAESDADHDTAIDQLQRFCRAEVCLSTEYDFGRRTGAGRGRRQASGGAKA